MKQSEIIYLLNKCKTIMALNSFFTTSYSGSLLLSILQTSQVPQHPLNLILVYTYPWFIQKRNWRFQALLKAFRQLLKLHLLGKDVCMTSEGFWTLHNLISICIFSILFSIYFLRCWQGEFVWQSRASLGGDNFLYSHDLNLWFGGEIVRRN